jgi:RNA polymerase sigma-70 factor (ECF subfamily)
MDYREIYNQYYAKIRRFILALVKDEWIADDLIQETFVRIQENVDSVKDPSRISPWIFRIAYNLCQDHFRQSRKSPNGESMGQEKPESSQEASIQKQLEQRQMGQCVQNHMSLLPESLRTVLILDGFQPSRDCRNSRYNDREYQSEIAPGQEETKGYP